MTVPCSLHYICCVEFPFQVLFSSSPSSWVLSLYIFPSFLKSSPRFSSTLFRTGSLFSDLLDDAEFEGSVDVALAEVCAGGGLLNKKLLISLHMARNG